MIPRRNSKPSAKISIVFIFDDKNYKAKSSLDYSRVEIAEEKNSSAFFKNYSS
jgi:hypothetical protein